MRQHRYSPLIGTVFSQRQREKNIFRVDNLKQTHKYNSDREYISINIERNENQMNKYETEIPNISNQQEVASQGVIINQSINIIMKNV